MSPVIFRSFLINFFHLHSSILKPDFNLPFGEIENPGDLVSAVSCEVHVKQEFLFQLQCLMFGVRAAFFSGRPCMQPVRGRVI